MPDLPLYFSTAACWLALAALAWRAARPAPAGALAVRGEVRTESFLVPVALVLHGMLLYRRVIVADGLDLGVANAVSLLVWLTALIYWVAAMAYEGLSGILGLIAPLAFVAVLLQALIPTRHVVTYGGDPLF